MRKARTIHPFSDSDILKGIASGDRNALERLYESCFPMVARMVCMNSGSEDEAKDVFQEAIMVLYDKLLRQNDFTLTSRLQTYLYSVSRRLWLKMLRDNGRSLPDGNPDNEESVDPEADLALYREKETQFDRMEKCLTLLGEPCRTILLDFYMQGKSMQEICKRLGYTNADNAKNQKYKCLKRLKKLFFEHS